MKINFVRLSWVLLVLTFFSPYILVAGLKLEVIPHLDSQVGGTAPLTISLTFEQNVEGPIRISFIGLNINTGESNDCRSQLEASEFLNRITMCALTGSTSDNSRATYTVIDSSGISIDDTITLTIQNVEYNKENDAKPLTVEVRSDINSDALIESATDDKSWIPVKLADFTIDSISLNQVTTCSLFDLTITGKSSMGIAKDSPIHITFDTDIGLDNLELISSIDVAIDRHENGVIIGRAIDGIEADKELTIELKELRGPSTTRNFKVTVTTFSINNKEVSSGNKDLSVTARTLTSTGVLALTGDEEICKTGDYSFTITQDCAPILSPSYELNYDSGSQAQSGIFAGKFPATCCDNNDKLDENQKTVKFSLKNPCSVLPKSTLSGENYIIAVKNSMAEIAFYYKLKLDDNIKYKAGSITDFKVRADPPRSYDEADYYFIMKNRNPINTGGKIILTLGIPVKCTETPTITLTSNSAIIDTSLTLCSDNKIEITLTGSISDSIPIEIKVAKLLNPMTVGSYPGFKAESFDPNGYAIDISNEANLLITSAGYIKVECERDSKINLATTEYTFTIASDKIEIMETDVLGISVSSGNILTGCNTGNYNPNFNNIADNIKYWLNIQPDQITDRKTVKFTYTNCQNAPTTETATLNFHIYDKDGNKKLEGSVDITNDKGASITNIAVNCDQEFQEQSYPCTLTFKRGSNTPFQSVVLIGTRLDLNNANCMYSDSYVHKSCEALQIMETKKIILKLTMKVNRIDVRINRVSIVLPKHNEDYIIEIKTYSNENPEISPLVDEAISTGLKGVCKEPCRQCKKGVSDECLSCDDSNQNKIYYLYPDGTRSCDEASTPISETNCRELESSNSCCEGYYDIKTPNTCLKCSSNCKNCQGDSRYCTECYNSQDILHNNECISNCPTYTYQIGKTCKPCGAHCRVCTSDTYCTMCESTHHIYERGLERTCESDCGSGKYIDIIDQICRNCVSPCATCIEKARTCESCDNLTLERHLIKEEHKCVTADKCIEKKDRVVNSAGDCVRCSNNCLTCGGTITNCLSCNDNLYLLTQRENSCVADCTLHNSYNEEDKKCHSCMNLCQTCISKDKCTSCIDNLLLFPDTMECMPSCPDFYFPSGRNCEKCKANCTRCTDQSTCIECVNDYFLEVKGCFLSCSDGYYDAGNKICRECDRSCETCRTSATNCIECANGYSWSSAGSNRCVSPCPDQMTSIFGVCTNCHADCASCSGSTTICTGCFSNKFLYNGECINSCPSYTIPKISTRTCVFCPIQCPTCAWSGSESSDIINCITCAPGFMYYNSDCVQHCPSDYEPSSDGFLCVNSSSSDYLSFPHLIIAGLLAIFVV